MSRFAGEDRGPPGGGGGGGGAPGGLDLFAIAARSYEDRRGDSSSLSPREGSRDGGGRGRGGGMGGDRRGDAGRGRGMAGSVGHAGYIPLEPPKRSLPNVPPLKVDGSERAHLIRDQVKFYFMDENWYFDDNIRQLAGRRDGFVPIPAILAFKRLTALRASDQDVLQACESEDLKELIEIHPEREMIKRRLPDSWSGYLALQKRIVYVSRLSSEGSIHEYKRFFDEQLRKIDPRFEVTAVRFFPPIPYSNFTQANIVCNSQPAAEALVRQSPYPSPRIGTMDSFEIACRPVNEETLWKPHNNWKPNRKPPERGRRGRGGGRGGGMGGRGGSRGGSRGGGDFGRGRGDPRGRGRSPMGMGGRGGGGDFGPEDRFGRRFDDGGPPRRFDDSDSARRFSPPVDSGRRFSDERDERRFDERYDPREKRERDSRRDYEDENKRFRY